MQTAIDLPRLKAISLTSVARAMGANLQKCGKHYRTLCPWHPDKNPSLVIYEDRKQNGCHCFACGVTKDVIAYVMQMKSLSFTEACQWLGAQYGIPTLDGQKASPIRLTTTTRPVMNEMEEKPLSFVPEKYVESTLSTSNSFSRCLELLFGNSLAHELTELYRLGCFVTRDGQHDTIFWTIDEDGRVHNGKVQRYVTNIRSPRFAHCEPLFGKNQRSFWLTKVLVRQGVVDKDARLDVGGLFGAHLLKQRPDDVVVLVESPKNAILGAAYFPRFVWVAAGNQGALKVEHVQCLKGRMVKVYPDRDAINDWKKRIISFKGIAHFEVSDFCERVAPEGQMKYDIADYIIETRLDELKAEGRL